MPPTHHESGRRSRPQKPARADDPRRFRLHPGSSLVQAIDLPQRDPESNKIVAGGHTLISTLKLRVATPELLVDIRGVEELKGIRIDKDGIRIGALATHVRTSGIRPTAQGAAALPPGGDGDRRSAGSQSWHDRWLARQCRSGGRLAGSHNRAQRGFRGPWPALQLPCGCRAIEIAEATIGVTGAAGQAFAGDAATRFLIGKRLSPEVIAEAMLLLGEATECLSDRYASAEYRASLLATDTKRALILLAE
jgi:aerobic carbon-monoxide dehydrogenase medium subunit